MAEAFVEMTRTPIDSNDVANVREEHLTKTARSKLFRVTGAPLSISYKNAFSQQGLFIYSQLIGQNNFICFSFFDRLIFIFIIAGALT